MGEGEEKDQVHLDYLPILVMGFIAHTPFFLLVTAALWGSWAFLLTLPREINQLAMLSPWPVLPGKIINLQTEAPLH